MCYVLNSSESNYVTVICLYGTLTHPPLLHLLSGIQGARVPDPWFFWCIFGYPAGLEILESA